MDDLITEPLRSSWGVIVAHLQIMAAHPAAAALVLAGLAVVAARASWAVARR